MSVKTVRPVELRKNAYTLPSYRFVSDETPRMRDREPTVPGTPATDALLLEASVGGNDYLLLEVFTTDNDYIRLEG